MTCPQCGRRNQGIHLDEWKKMTIEWLLRDMITTELKEMAYIERKIIQVANDLKEMNEAQPSEICENCGFPTRY